MRIEGKILGVGNKSIAATVTLMDPAGPQLIDIAPGDLYKIDIDDRALDVQHWQIVFSSPGYSSLSLTVGDLMIGPKDIQLQKANHLFLIVAAAGLFYAFSKTKKKAVGKLQTQDLMPFLMIAGGVLAFSALSKLLSKLGIGPNPAEEDQSDPNSPWKPTYWRQFTNYSYSITLQQADQYAKTIWEALNVFDDEFAPINGVFSNLKTKANVSFLSDIFFRKYERDLLGFLKNGSDFLPWDGLSLSNMAIIIKYVNGLPTN